MKRSGYRIVSGVVFGLMAIGQATRAALKLPAQVGSMSIPIWLSWVALVAAGTLCVWAFRSPGE